MDYRNAAGSEGLCRNFEQRRVGTPTLQLPALQTQLVFDHVADQIGVRSHGHLVEEPRPIGPYTLHTQRECRCDLLEAPAGTDESQDFELALRERLVPLLRWR